MPTISPMGIATAAALLRLEILAGCTSVITPFPARWPFPRKSSRSPVFVWTLSGLG